MAVDIGCEAIDRPSYFTHGYTRINKTKPAEVAGIITSIEIWALTDITGLKVGTVYTTNGNRLKCRASEAIAGTITAGSKVTKAVSIAVEIGDYIAYYCYAGYIEETGAGAGTWSSVTDRLDPDVEWDYKFHADSVFSLGGYITPPVVGWTGKISGVTNPAKIMGVDVANIAKVKGVVSA